VQVIGAALCVTVRDWGKGIGSHDLTHIFEPFRQGVQNDRSHRGLGLGLAISRSIVDLCGGELHASSEGEGRGATFTLRLPMTAVASGFEPTVRFDLDDDERRRLSGMRVLYVEDEPDIGEAARLMLSDLGAQVDLCTSFESARDRILAGGFDVLLSDLNLGDGRTAFELIEVLRATPHSRAVPALVLSAYGSQENRNASLRAGFSVHLVKPIAAVAVARALIDAVAGPRHR
jgi:CheY-like chemotaxis protein